MPVINFDRFELGIDRRKGRGVSDSNRLYDMLNCYVTTGWALKKRPGLTKVANLGAGSVGLMPFDGKLNTFSAVSNPVHPTATNGVGIDNHQVPYSASATDDVKAQHFADVFNGAIYVAIEYASGNVEHHYITGSSPYHITDVNCPHTKAGIRLAEKIWAVDDDVVDYCATGDPTDWTTTNDAGFLPTGLKTPGTEEALGLGEFNGQLAVFMSDAIQVWAVDPDPSNNGLDKVIQNVGTEHPLSIHQISGDLFFLAPHGYRSIALQKFTNNMEDLDVGTPIDEIVTPLLVSGINPRAHYFSGGGQWWCAIGDIVHVYSFSRTAEVSAWSRYQYPFEIDDIAALGANLYLRSGDSVYLVDDSVHTDDTVLYDVEIEMSFQAFKKPGVLKQVTGLDIVSQGAGEIAHRHNAEDPDEITNFVPFDGDSRPGPITPVEVVATELAPVIKNRDDKAFRLDSLSYHYENLGVL